MGDGAVTRRKQQGPDTPDLSAPEAVDQAMIEEPGSDVALPESEALRPESAPAPEPQRQRGFWLLLMGGVCAAALGAAAAIYVFPMLPASWQPASAELRAVAAGQSERIAELGAEIAALRATIPQAPDLGPLKTALTDLRDRTAALETRPVEAAPDATPAIAALQADLADLRTKLAQGVDASQISSAEITAAAAAASARIAAAEAEAADLRARAEASASRVLAQAALGHLRATLESGAPMADALAQLQAAGITVPVELAADIPSLAVLRSAFVPAAREALAAARQEAAGESTLDRLASFLMAQTGARSLAPREGTDADAVLSRAEAALSRDDLASSLAEIAALPEAARAKLAAWQALAERRLAATQALAALAQSLN